MLRSLTALWLGWITFSVSAADEGALNYERDVLPILNRLCVDCHGPEKQKGDIRFDELSTDFAGGGDADTWHDALNQVHLGEMPPAKAEHQPTDEERRILTGWLDAGLKAAALAVRDAGGRVESRRLTRYEYANTMRDLLGIDLDFARELPPEPASPEGFLNNGTSLEMSPTQLETYLAVARKALDLVIVEGEKPTIFLEEAKETAVGKLPKKKDGGAIPVNPEFILDIPKYPRSGEFEITVKAGAVVPEGNDFPRMRVSLGCVPGIIHVPRKVVGEVDVTASAEAPETFVFRGRMEDYPQAGDQSFGNAVAFKGIIVLIDFFDADDKELRYPHRRYSNPPPKPPRKGAKVSVLPPAPKGPLLDVVIDSVRYVAPVVSSWPPQSHVALLGEASAEGLDDRKKCRAVLERFLPKAFRRPVTKDEIDTFENLFLVLRERSGNFEEAIRETLAAVLVSPHFLHLVDTGDDFAVANRLAYFLWSTMPDDQLMKLAKEGRLNETTALASEVERMMNDSRAREFVERFADQWFDLGGLDRVAVNPEFFPNFDNQLKLSMRTEMQEFFGQILQGDLSCLELIDSNWTMANRALAKHYGLAEIPSSGRFERVALEKKDRRGGVLGQGGFLLANSNGESSHPIKRAVWVLDRLLGTPPSPPPPDVPELDEESADLARLTLKQKLAAHREKASCNQCHLGIDPWGVALEHFDATGIYRNAAPVRSGSKAGKQGAKLDSQTSLPDGTQLTGVDDLKQYLLDARRDHFARAVVRRVASYALGRSLDLTDREDIEQLTATFSADGLRLRGLIVELVCSDLFRDP